MPQGASASSISIKALSHAVQSAVEAAVKKQKLPPLKPEPGLVISDWLIGFILREAELQELRQIQNLANEVAGELQGNAAIGLHAAGAGSGARGGAAAYIHGGHIICGYRPGPVLPVLRD